MMAVAERPRASESAPVQEEVDGDGEAERDDEGAQNFVADAPSVARAGVAADCAGDHHVPAESPLDSSVDDEGDNGNAVGGGGDDDLERVDLGEPLDSAKSQRGHCEQAGPGAEVADVIANAQERDQQWDECDMLVTVSATLDAASYSARDGPADGEAGSPEQEQIRYKAQK